MAAYDKKSYLQCQCNVNTMFRLKKTSEVNTSKIIPKKETKKKMNIKDEQVNDKLSILNDIDIFLK